MKRLCILLLLAGSALCAQAADPLLAELAKEDQDSRTGKDVDRKSVV